MEFQFKWGPWWGGQFERLIGLVKNTMYKSIGSSMLIQDEYEEVLRDIEPTLILDIELNLNSRPLIFVLTPNALIHRMNIVNLEESSDNIDEYELRKRSRYVQKCKENAQA